MFIEHDPQPTFDLILLFSSFKFCSCFFHSSTFAVDSCSAFVSLVLLFLSVCSSISHLRQFEELEGRTSFWIISVFLLEDRNFLIEVLEAHL